MTEARSRRVFIRHREFIRIVSKITGYSQILLEYEFGKAEILGKDVCVVEMEITGEQAASLDRAARRSAPLTMPIPLQTVEEHDEE